MTSNRLSQNTRALNFAHRGFTQAAPENTPAAFKAAIELGVDGIELDVRICKTGEVVVFHDSKLERLTNGSGFIKNLSLSEIKRLRIKSDKTASTHKIPTLAEVLDLVDGRVILNIEIKVNGLPPKHGIEEKVVDILKQFKVKHSTIISSFHPLTVRRIKRIDDEVINGILIEKNFTIRNYEIFFLKMAGAKAIHIEGGLANSSLIDQVNKRGFYSLVWTVNEPELMRNLIEWGASGIITDRPDVLREIKERHYVNE